MTASVAFLINHWRVLAVVGALIAVLGAYQLGKGDGYRDAIADQLRSNIKAERERAKDDAKIRGLSDYDFCVLALRRRGLQFADCEQLRGIP